MPRQHRTDHLGAAIRPLDAAERAAATDRYAALLGHYGMVATTNNAGIAHENGAVEQAHHRFKQAVDQALRVRGSRDFPTRAVKGPRAEHRARRHAGVAALVRDDGHRTRAPCA